jgi:hypothetical protein
MVMGSSLAIKAVSPKCINHTFNINHLNTISFSLFELICFLLSALTSAEKKSIYETKKNNS